MADLNKRLIFETEWFARNALRGIEAVLTKQSEAGSQLEAQLLRHLLISLLDAQRGPEPFRHREMLDFFAFCQLHLPKSTSQILQDLWVLFMLGEKRDGYFVEFGACDGKLLSNSWLLESRYGWSGILAEPNPVWHEALKRNRTATIVTDCVAARSGETVDFLCTDTMPELSRMADVVPDDVHERVGARGKPTKIKVRTISLNDLLEQNNAPEVIDYLSIDTEGSEHEILSQTDFERWRFRLITVEHAGETAKREMVHSLLTERGYRRWNPLMTRWDDWYLLAGDTA